MRRRPWRTPSQRPRPRRPTPATASARARSAPPPPPRLILRPWRAPAAVAGGPASSSRDSRGQLGHLYAAEGSSGRVGRLTLSACSLWSARRSGRAGQCLGAGERRCSLGLAWWRGWGMGWLWAVAPPKGREIEWGWAGGLHQYASTKTYACGL